MADHDRQHQGGGSHTSQSLPGEVKQEPGSPATSETSSMGYHNTSGGLQSQENGYCHGNTSDDSMDTSTYDAPLDFSLKRDRKHVEVFDEREILRDPHTEIVIPRSPRSPTHRNGRNSTANNTSQANGALPDDNSKDSFSDGGGAGSGPDPGAKIGEPQTALPGTLPGTILPGIAGAMPGLTAVSAAGLFPSAAAAGMIMMGNFPMGQMDPKRGHSQRESGNNKLGTRPFKAYPKDPLSLPLGYYGIPGMLPFPQVDTATAQAMSMSTEELFNQYRQYVQKLQTESQFDAAGPGGIKKPRRGSFSSESRPDLSKLAKQISPDASKTVPLVISPTTPTSGVPTSTSSSTSSPDPGLASMPALTPPLSANLPASTSPGHSPTVTTSSSRKPGRILPDDQKDQAYWERRRKNNEAAKRSRDARRAKEDEIAIRAAFLEQENLKLRVEVAALKNETAKLRCMLYNS